MVNAVETILNMRLKYIAGLALLCILILLVGLHLLVSHWVLYPGFTEIEDQTAQRNMGRCRDAIAREIYHLDLITKDWASWDDSYQFIEDLNAGYIKSTLVDESFESNNVQLIYYLNTRGQVVWHQIYDHDQELKEEQIQSIHQTVTGLSGYFMQDETVHGLVSTEVVPLLVACRGIYDSQDSKPCRGRLIMGRLLNPAMMWELTRQTRVDFEVLPLDVTFLKKNHGEPSNEEDYHIEKISSAQLAISSTYPDLNGRPACTLRAILNRSITFAGKEVILYSLIAIVSTSIILFTFLLYILNACIIHPISSLTEQIRKLRKNKVPNQLVRVSRGHETQALAKEFNRLMRRLEWDHQKRLRAEKQLLESIRSAQEANRVKSDFLANMSHEIRTPMNSIIGFSDLLLEEDLTNSQKDFLQTIRSNGGMLLTLINDILDMSRIEAGNMAIEFLDCSLVEITDSVKHLIQPLAANKTLDFRISLSPALPETFTSDPLRLRQCLINLLGNAIKFTHKGHVYLNIYNIESEQGQSICLAVEDTGIGIPIDQQKKVFEPFIQADSSTTRKFGGSGLGLAITHKLVLLLGGTITLQSEPGKGSVFTITLPVKPVSSPCRKIDLSGNNGFSVSDTTFA